MSMRPEILEIDVDGSRLGAVRWLGETGAPVVLAAHGITANAWSWSAVARHLERRCELIAVDLRGRGRSSAAAGPFGMRRHADDLAAIAEHLELDSVTVAGHSLGAYVALTTAARHPDLVDGLVLVDGGQPIDLPPDTDPQDMIDAIVGPAMGRLQRVWIDRVEYRTMWGDHPAFAEGLTPEVERYLLSDLESCDGGFRSVVSETAVRFDGGELLLDDEIRSLFERRSEPATIVRAELGVMAEPPPFMSERLIADHPHHDWRTVPGSNHYTVLVGEHGAAVTANAMAQVGTRR